MRLRTFVLVSIVGACMMLTAAPTVDASPMYLMKQRAGQQFIYEIHHGMLQDSFYNYPYVLNEGMNIMLKRLSKNSALQTLSSVGSNTVNSCLYEGAGGTGAAGCVKMPLHTGIAGDCVATNPLCCVLYWRFPASLPDRLHLRDIDPRLIFWDGTRTVNGFYTNFSMEYLVDSSNCSVWPEKGSTASEGAVLSVDSDGGWRFTSSLQTLLSVVEHRITSPTREQLSVFSALRAAGEAELLKGQQFGDVNIAAPVSLCVVFLIGCLVLLLLFYCCTVPQARRQQAELQTTIEILEASTAKKESEICRRRTRSDPRVSKSERHTPASSGSLTRASKVGTNPNTSQRSFSAPSRSPSDLTTASVLNRQGHPPQPSLQGATSSGRAAGVNPDYRHQLGQRAASQQIQRVSSNLSHGNGIKEKALTRPATHGSFTPSPARRSPQSFQNPLLGRQSFKH
ncbi:hypothetical protein ABL78_6324 [Leptomonas seymouri]|uniref:Transmembrane protein n=1 Tax=Leptomonas seymouri TaxID=5684 RepID=A0A0N0P3W9_LEPSE|nr:hypothetical protein ABL78_6324 [Leptomonas seymouri]|eukprot:KPI84619.1 hypothetical protein ABL78_6324 [Leptomonas seymouri]